jgi:hypothetical protein
MAENKFPVTVVIGAVDNVTYKVMEINQKLERITKPLGQLKTAFGDLGRESGLNKLGSAIGNVGTKGTALFKELGAAGLKVGAILATVGFAFAKIVKGAADSGDAIKDASDRLGVSTKFFQEFQFAASQTGVDMAKVEAGLTKFSKALGDAQAGTGEGVGVFRGLGIALKDSAGKARGMEKILPELADKLQKIQDPALRNSVAMRLFGRDGAKLAVTLGKGSAGLAEFSKEAQRLGLVMGDDQINSANAFNDSWDKLALSVGRARDAFGAELFPVLIELFEKLSTFLAENRPQIIEFARAFAKELPGILMTLKDLFVGLWGAVQPLIAGFKMLTSIFGTTNTVLAILAGYVGGPVIMSFLSFGKAIWQLGAAAMPVLIRGFMMLLPLFKGLTALMIANPIGAIIAGVVVLGGLAVLLYNKWEPFRNLIDGIWEKIKAVGSFIGGGVKSLFGGESAATGSPLDAKAVVKGAQGIASSKTENQISVNFENMPKGTRVIQNKAEAPMDLSMGYSMAGM